jgi:hypothetical protein
MDQLNPLSIALKEWDTVRAALRSGRQMVLLRKGGIADRGQEFRLEHDRFLIFPTFVHQDYRLLKPEAHGRFKPAASEPGILQLDTAAQVSDIVRIDRRAQIDALDAEHIWSPVQIEMRLSYKPEKPLFLMIVRAYALAAPVTISNTPAYAGCKSWVPLDEQVSMQNAHAALDDHSFEARRRGILDQLGQRVP